jgi:hypothetical protein
MQALNTIFVESGAIRIFDPSHSSSSNGEPFPGRLSLLENQDTLLSSKIPTMNA